MKELSEKDYFAAIAQIRRYIAEDKMETAEHLLEQMYAYKPVRLLWFVAKAEYVLRRTGNADDALSILHGESFMNRKFFLDKNYPGLEDCMQFRIKALRQSGAVDDAIREEYSYRKACGENVSALEDALATAIEEFAQDSENAEALSRLGDAYYHTADMIAFWIVRFEQIRSGIPQKDTKSAWYYQPFNYGYLEEKAASQEANTFILVTNEDNSRSLEILGFLLSQLGHQVFLLIPPLSFETEAQLDLKDTISISLEHMEAFPDLCVIPPIILTQNGAAYGDNRAYLIDYICKNERGKDNAVVLCDGRLLEDLCVRKELRGRIGRLSACVDEFAEEKLHFGWAGSYLSYISDIYGYDVRTDLNAPAEVDFSIVIPARNSTKTLRYTLETCLKQTYRGSYEIVVSDNSVGQDTSVYELCQELNDPKIRYYQTPRLLYLTKSFEFAYLKAKGAFVLSIGSDDALLPWGLEALKSVLDRYPQEDIIQWERGFYAWPGFNGGQENQFDIPRKYEKGHISVYQMETKTILKYVAEDIQRVYSMPFLYLNSGFRRRYFRTLFQKTGKLWDGVNQDMQMGVVNCCIFSHILQMIYPITIAGMSSSSMGYLGSGGAVGRERKKAESLRWRQCRQDNIGGYSCLSRERLLSTAGVDACSLYMVLSRAVEENLLSSESADQIWDWRRAVTKVFQTYPITSDGYDLFLHWSRLVAGRMGASQAEWFNRLYQVVVAPRYIDEKDKETPQEEKLYQEGVNSQGGEKLDASKYGVHNVAEAAEFFALRSGLGGAV